MNDEERAKEWYLNFVSEHKLLILSLPNIHLSNPQNQLSCDRKFNDALEEKVILYPKIVGLCWAWFDHIGVCCGNIRIACFSITKNVCVWELEEEEDHCRWRRLHNFNFPDKYNLVSPISRSREAVLAFHPHHGDVVFIQLQRPSSQSSMLNHCIFVVNLKTQCLEVAEYQTHRFHYWEIISLDLPLWPTIIPSITSI
ncbi:hypothetical protein SESBI_27602 [Sesbania bispinosa]|nr:hypothetical protein SESBI_27602 [Sesbania bispinosa]